MRHIHCKPLLALAILLFTLPLSATERGVKRTTLSSPVPVATPYLAGQYRALVIGNDDYDDPEQLWPSLKTAIADTEAVAELLRSEYGFAEITLLRNAKQREIVRAFNRLAQAAQENDSVLIYYKHMRNKNRTATIDWILQRDWKLAITLTFKKDCTEHRARKTMKRLWYGIDRQLYQKAF